MLKTFFFVLALAGLFAGPNIHGLSWPEFRGPEGQGHAAGARSLPLQWSSKKNIAWRTDVPGRGWSSPILYRDRI